MSIDITDESISSESIFVNLKVISDNSSGTDSVDTRRMGNVINPKHSRVEYILYVSTRRR